MVMLISAVSCGGPNVTEDPQPKANGWLVEAGAPTDAFGLAEGQMCLDQDSFDLYQLVSGEWILVGSVRGSSEDAPVLENKNGIWYINGRNTKLFGTDSAKITLIGGYLHINGVDTGILQVYDEVELKDQKDYLLRAISRLNDREKLIMCMRYGLAGYDELTQKEVADTMNISQSYISRLEKKILHKLKDDMQNCV